MSMVRLNDLLPSDQKVPDWGLNSKDDDILPSNSEGCCRNIMSHYTANENPY